MMWFGMCVLCFHLKRHSNALRSSNEPFRNLRSATRELENGRFVKGCVGFFSIQIAFFETHIKDAEKKRTSR